MPEPPEDRIDYLLSRGGVSGPQKRRILDEILSSAHALPARPRRRWWVWGGGLGFALAAGATALLLWARPMNLAGGEFRAKGSEVAGVTIDLWCLGGELQACPRGSRVAFSVEGAGERAKDATLFLSAYAVPSPVGERVWYVLNEPVVGATLRKAVQIGSEHGPGLHRVEIVLARRPLSRAEVVAAPAGDVLARKNFELRVTP